MFTNIIRFVFAIFCINSVTAFAGDLIIGTTSAYAPYVSLNDKGEYEGFDIDIANELGKKLNKRVVIKDLGSMPSLFLALKQNKVDALIWAISITAERQNQVEMVYYQGAKVTELPLLFWKVIPANIRSIQDMVNDSKASLAVEAGSFQESFLKSVPGLNIKNVDKFMDAILEIKYGKSIATMIDPALLSKTTTQFPEIKVLNVPLPLNEQSFGNGICINKSNSVIASQIRQAIDALRSEGKIAELESKWNLAER